MRKRSYFDEPRSVYEGLGKYLLVGAIAGYSLIASPRFVGCSDEKSFIINIQEATSSKNDGLAASKALESQDSLYALESRIKEISKRDE